VNKSTMKKIILFVSSFLLVISLAVINTGHTANESFLKQVWGSCGPCFSTFTDCGYPNDMGTCVWDGSGCGGGTGECNRRCPGTADHWACMELIGSCTITWEICAEWEQPACLIAAANCTCTNAVPQGTFCFRSTC